MKTRVDVAIVGAGTAGAAAALLCARRGLSVACVERRKLAEAGARWVNDVPAWMFDEAGLDRPASPELLDTCERFHLLAGEGLASVAVRAPDVLGVDMRALVARLQSGAEAAGARMIGEAQGARIEGNSLRTSAGEIEARWFVDASGLAGAKLLAQPAPERTDLCAASQAVIRVKDMPAARAFFAARGAEPGETLCFTGVAGGFSTRSMRLVDDTLSIVTGSIPALGHAPGERILRDFAASQPWVGEPLFGGSRAIPLRFAYERIADDRVAALGDAAAQVFSAHGSGIGAGLVAARLLADALAEGRGTEGYARDWQRRFGALHAGYDLMRRLSQRLTAEDIARMIRAGLLDESLVRAGLEQRWPEPTMSMALGKIGAAAREPRLAARLLGVAGRMPALRAHYTFFPRDDRARRAWSVVRAGLMGVRS